MRKRRKNSSFTLLELLVALALMAALTSSLYVTFRIAFSGREHSDAALAPARTAMQTMDLIRSDLDSAMAPTGLLAGAFTGVNATGSITGGESDTLSFYSCANTPEGPDNPAVPPPPAGDVRFVQYSLTTVLPTDTTNTLQRQTTTNLLSPNTETPVTDYLCQNVVSFTVQYFDGSNWWPSWDSTQQGNVLPNAVQVTLELQPPPTAQTPVTVGQNTYLFTRIFLPPCSPAIAANQVQGTQGLSGSSGLTSPSGLQGLPGSTRPGGSSGSMGLPSSPGSN